MAGPGFYWMGEEERREVLDVLESGYLFRYGELDDPGFKAKTYTLEREFARRCGVAHCVACASGTSALLMALHAIGLSPGDEIIVPAYTFVATYSAIVFAGGVPVLAEIDDSLTLDPADLERRITPRTRALMPVHMLGNPCDMDAIMDVARRHGLPVIEDACQANGATLPRAAGREHRRTRGVLAEHLQDHQLGRRRPARDRRPRPLRARVRVPRPGTHAEPRQRGGRPAHDARAQLPDERAHGGGRARPVEEVRIACCRRFARRSVDFARPSARCRAWRIGRCTTLRVSAPRC